MRARLRSAATGALVAAAAAACAMTACGGHPAATSSSRPETAVRWLSDPAGRAGSLIDPDHPAAAAARLHASRTGYCAMLRASLAGGPSALRNVRAGDPTLRASAEAFVAEVTALAPEPAGAAWRVFGPTLLQVVMSAGSGGSTGVAGAATAGATRAQQVIASDAKAACQLDLARPAR
jgi:hypothetical protein